MTEIIKRKCTSFFKCEDREKVKQAVKQVHQVMTNASLLMKAFYLKDYETKFESKVLNPEDYSKFLEINSELFHICCSIVQGDTKLSTRNTKDNDKPEKKKNSMSKEQKNQYFIEILELYQSFSFSTVKTTLSLSHILSYSINTMMTAYQNNVTMRFPCYVRKYIRCKILQLLCIDTLDRHNSYLARKISNHILYDQTLPNESIPGLDIDGIKHLLLPQRGINTFLTNDLESRPWIYLAYMVFINRMIENNFLDVPGKFRKLLNPFAMTTSFIPNHIRLDTAGMAQLLMTKNKIDEFVDLYELNHGIRLNMKTKTDMLSSYAKLTNKSTTLKEDALYFTELWKFNCKIENNKINKKVFVNKRKSDNWVFDNSVVTDGYAISFQVTRESNFEKKVKYKKKGISKENTEDGETTKDVEKQNKKKRKKNDNKEVREFLDLGDEELSLVLAKNKYKLLANDPGKVDILAIGDGIKNITYTKFQRHKDTKTKVRNKQSKKLRTKQHVVGSFGSLENPTIHDFESQHMSLSRRNTCTLKSFVEYFQSWKSMEVEGTMLYGKAFFRQMKVFVYNATKSSEHKFFNKVKDTFSKPSPSGLYQWIEKTDDKISKTIEEKATEQPEEKIAVAWGDWGKNPNLKNNAPSPGIGIRRRASKHFWLTFTTPEYNSSKTCPCCRTTTLTNPRVGEESIAKHHLLRCTNEDCMSRWWNRNIAGYFNILYKAYEALNLDKIPESPIVCLPTAIDELTGVVVPTII